MTVTTLSEMVVVSKPRIVIQIRKADFLAADRRIIEVHAEGEFIEEILADEKYAHIKANELRNKWLRINCCFKENGHE